LVKKQIDKLVANIKRYLAELEKAEDEIQKCKEETGLSLTQIEKACSRLKKYPQDEAAILVEYGITMEKLKSMEAMIREANRKLKNITKETGYSVTAFKKILFNSSMVKKKLKKPSGNSLKPICGWLSALLKNTRIGGCSFWI
jgi:RNA polymerase primary sigma factor